MLIPIFQKTHLRKTLLCLLVVSISSKHLIEGPKEVLTFNLLWIIDLYGSWHHMCPSHETFRDLTSLEKKSHIHVGFIVNTNAFFLEKYKKKTCLDVNICEFTHHSIFTPRSKRVAEGCFILLPVISPASRPPLYTLSIAVHVTKLWKQL